LPVVGVAVMGCVEVVHDEDFVISSREANSLVSIIMLRHMGLSTIYLEFQEQKNNSVLLIQ
jgi:hypothetical protein